MSQKSGKYRNHKSRVRFEMSQEKVTPIIITCMQVTSKEIDMSGLETMGFNIVKSSLDSLSKTTQPIQSKQSLELGSYKMSVFGRKEFIFKQLSFI